MLNLVQLQERLKDVPMQALMQYANGANPQVPPFLALGELNRRKKMQEGAAAEQAAEMEGAPTVKQQIEQAAGLMALQGNRQRQAAQQQAGIQAVMPMAAPNTTTSEPAQLAGGGFIDDIVVPRDYAPGGSVIDPEDLKRTMLREAMQRDVKDIPKELTNAVARAALRRRPGIAGVPLPTNMFRRSDYAGGGIVAFAGPQGSFVERGPGFYQLEEEIPEDEQRAAMLAQLPPEIREMLRVAEKQKQLMSPEAVRARRKEAGLPTLVSELPDTGAKTLEELQRQKAAFDASDTFANRLLSLTPGRRFGTGETGRGLVAYEKERATKSGELGKAIASAQDLREKAKLDFMEGRFKESETALAAANKVEADIASKLPEALYRHKLGAQAEAGKTTNFTQLMEIIDEAKRNPTPENIRRMQSAISAAGYVTYQGPRTDVLAGQLELGERKEGSQDYEAAAKIIDPMIARGGSRYKEYRKKQKEEGQAAADALREDLIQAEIRRMRGGQGGAQPRATPAPTTGTLPAGLPPGSKQIGTSNGKPVYQLPNGQKVVAQ